MIAWLTGLLGGQTTESEVREQDGQSTDWGERRCLKPSKYYYKKKRRGRYFSRANKVFFKVGTNIADLYLRLTEHAVARVSA